MTKPRRKPKPWKERVGKSRRIRWEFWLRPGNELHESAMDSIEALKEEGRFLQCVVFGVIAGSYLLNRNLPPQERLLGLRYLVPDIDELIMGGRNVETQQLDVPLIRKVETQQPDAAKAFLDMMDEDF